MFKKGKKGGDKGRVGERQGERLTMEDLRMVENMTNIQSATFRAELDFDVPELRNQANRLERDLTDKQRDIYNSVITAVKDNTPLSLFIVAWGGCGKTYLLNTILKKYAL